MRIDQLTFTRFLFAILIVVFHYGKESPLFNNSYLDFIVNQAHIGVSYFFLLSGFVMMIAYSKKDKIEWLEYLKNRFARIYPIYFGALLLILVIQLLTKTFDLEGLILNVLMIQAWFPEKALIFNPVAWSLSVELFLYLSFPIIYNNFIKKYSFKKVVVCFLIFWIVSQIIVHGLLMYKPYGDSLLNLKLVYFNPLLHLNEFLIGLVTGYLFIEKISNKSRNTDFLLIVTVIFMLLILKYNTVFHLPNGMLAFPFGFFIILLAINNGIITRFFKLKICVFLGEISYSIYILQFAVFSLISSETVNKYLKITDYTAVFFIRLIILIALSAIAYKYLEMPLRDKIKKL